MNGRLCPNTILTIQTLFFRAMLGSSVIPLQVLLKWYLLFHPATETWILLEIQESCKNLREVAPSCPILRHLISCGSCFNAQDSSTLLQGAHLSNTERQTTVLWHFSGFPFSHAITVNNYWRASNTQFAGVVLLCTTSNKHPFHYSLKNACVCHWQTLTLIPDTTPLPSISCFLDQACMQDMMRSMMRFPKFMTHTELRII